jgi:hypothetical protein
VVRPLGSGRSLVAAQPAEEATLFLVARTGCTHFGGGVAGAAVSSRNVAQDTLDMGATARPGGLVTDLAGHPSAHIGHASEAQQRIDGIVRTNLSA